VSLLLRRLDRTRIPPGPRPSCKPRFSWGFPPFQCSPPRGKRRGGVGEERRRGEGGSRTPRRHWCAKTGDHLCSCGAGPVAGRGAGAVRDGWKAGAEKGAGCCREHLHRATVFVRPATTTPPPLRERRLPLSSRAACLPCPLPMIAPSSRREPVRRHFPMNGC
jgi:hypothetical protein